MQQYIDYMCLSKRPESCSAIGSQSRGSGKAAGQMNLGTTASKNAPVPAWVELAEASRVDHAGSPTDGVREKNVSDGFGTMGELRVARARDAGGRRSPMCSARIQGLMVVYADAERR